MSNAQNKNENRFMEFRLTEQLFAIPLLTVKEVILKPDVTPVPNSPPHFEGMINLRGQILGVYNVRKKLGAGNRIATEKMNEVVIIAEEDGILMGIVVDEVTRVVNPELDKIKSAPLSESNPAHAFVSAVIESQDQLTPIIKFGELLEIHKFKIAEHAA